MAARIRGLGAGLLKYFPILAILLAIYQYYREAGGIQGFLLDIKNLSMKQLEAKWTTVAIGIAMFVGADVLARYVPGKLKYVVKAIMYYLGASQLLSVLQGMYTIPAETQTAMQQRSTYRGGAY